MLPDVQVRERGPCLEDRGQLAKYVPIALLAE